MAAIPSVKERVRDFGLGIVAPAVMTPVILGVASLGTPNQLAFYSDVQTLKDERGEGPGVEAAAHVLSQGGGPIGFVGIDPSIAASNGSVQYAGTGPLISVSGNATLDARFRIKILKRGILGSATFAYCCDDFPGATDSERTYSEELVVPTGGTFTVPVLGLTVTFPAPMSSTVAKSGSGPDVTLTGTPAGDYVGIIEITTGGAVGAAVFRWSIDGGATWTSGVTTAATVALGTTGLTANFSAGSYVAADTYSWTTLAYAANDQYYVDVECAAWNAADLADAYAALGGSAEWRFAVAITSKGCGDATAHALLVTAQEAHLTTLANASKFRRAMIAAEQFDVPANTAADAANAATVVTAFSNITATRQLVAYGSIRRATTKPFPGYAFPVVHAVEAFAAQATAALPSTDLKRVESGPLAAVQRIFHDEAEVPTLLDNVKVSTLRTWEGRDGFYVTQGRLKSPQGSDFTHWPRGIVMDIACETVHQLQIGLIGRGFRLNPDGTLHELDAIRWEEEIAPALVAQLLTPRNAEGFDGHITDLRYRISRTHNVRATGVIISSVGILPLGYADYVETELGFVVALPEAAA